MIRSNCPLHYSAAVLHFLVNNLDYFVLHLDVLHLDSRDLESLLENFRVRRLGCLPAQRSFRRFADFLFLDRVRHLRLRFFPRELLIRYLRLRGLELIDDRADLE